MAILSIEELNNVFRQVKEKFKIPAKMIPTPKPQGDGILVSYENKIKQLEKLVEIRNREVHFWKSKLLDYFLVVRGSNKGIRRLHRQINRLRKELGDKT